MLAYADSEWVKQPVSIFVGGEVGVGKSVLVERFYKGDRFNATVDGQPQPTIGNETRTLYNYHVPGTHVELPFIMLIDTAGQVKFAVLWDMWIKRAQVIFLVFRYISLSGQAHPFFLSSLGSISLVDMASFVAIQQRWPDLQGKCRADANIVLLGNKLDLVEADPTKRAVTMEQGKTLAMAIKAKHYYEVSALAMMDTTPDEDRVAIPLNIALKEVVEARQVEAAALMIKTRGRPEQGQSKNPLILLGDSSGESNNKKSCC